jgi:hypothetical protein
VPWLLVDQDVATLCVFSAQYFGCDAIRCSYFGFHNARLYVVVPAESKVNDLNLRVTLGGGKDVDKINMKG